MRQKFLFIKMLWSVISGKQKGWVFLKITDQQQIDFLNNEKNVELIIRYLGVDDKVIKKIVKRLEN
jgi:hypothetical protein